MSPFDEDPADNKSELDLCIDEIKILKERNKALEQLLVCYRVGKNPSEKLLIRVANDLKKYYWSN